MMGEESIEFNVGNHYGTSSLRAQGPCSYCGKDSKFYQYFPNCDCHYCFKCLRKHLDSTTCPTCGEDWNLICKELPEKLNQEDEYQMEKGYTKCKYPLCSTYLERKDKALRRKHERHCRYRTKICYGCGKVYLANSMEKHQNKCKAPDDLSDVKLDMEEDGNMNEVVITQENHEEEKKRLHEVLKRCNFPTCEWTGSNKELEEHTSKSHHILNTFSLLKLKIMMGIAIFMFLLFTTFFILYATKQLTFSSYLL